MKAISHIVLGACVLMLLGCSDEEEPRFRIRNDRPTKANVQVKTSGGNTININDVESGVVTGYDNAAEGIIEATATIQNETVSPTISFFAHNGQSYTIVVVNSTPPTLAIVSP